MINQSILQDGGSRVAHFRDPENNLIEICCELPREKWSEDLLEDIS